MKKRILISGGNGKLACAIKKHEGASKYIITTPSKKRMDICDINSISKVINEVKPDYFIHAAAFTRPMKKHEEFPDKSIKANIIRTANVAIVCNSKSIKLVYISTDYVYPGTEGNYGEKSSLSPYSECNDGISKYGWSKLGGECAVRITGNHLIIRACLCDYPFPHPAALVDVRKSLIYTKDAAPIILSLLDYQGIINLGGRAQSVFSFAQQENKFIRKIFRNQINDAK